MQRFNEGFKNTVMYLLYFTFFMPIIPFVGYTLLKHLK